MATEETEPLIHSRSRDEPPANALSGDTEEQSSSCCKGGKVGQKRARIIAITVFSILLLVLLLLFILYVFVFPSIVNGLMSKATLRVVQCMIKDYSESGFSATMTVELNNPSDWDIVISEMLTDIKNSEKAKIGKIKIPELSLVKGETKSFTFTSQFTIIGEAQFKEFVLDLLRKEEISWTLSSTMSVSSQHFPMKLSGIELEREIKLSGMDNFQNIEIKNFSLPSADGVGIAVDIEAHMENKSAFGILLGNIYFDILYDSVLMGVVRSKDFEILPGSNPIFMNGSLVPYPLSASTTVSRVFSNFINGKPSKMTVKGRYEPNSNADLPWWIRYLISEMRFEVLLHRSEFSPVEKIELTRLDCAEILDLQDLPVEGGMNIVYAMPFGFPVELRSLSSSVVLKEQGTDNSLATISFDRSPVINQSGNSADVLFKGKLTRTGKFEELLKSLIFSAEVVVDAKGQGDISALSNVGSMMITDVKISKQMAIKGVNQFRDPPPKIVDVRVIRGDQYGLGMAVTVLLYNPSPFNVKIGDTKLEIKYKEKRIASATIRNFSLISGTNQVIVECSQDTFTTDPIVREFLSNYASGIASEMYLVGTERSTNYPILNSIFKDLQIPNKFPGLSRDQMLVKATEVGMLASQDFRPGGGFHLMNDWDVPVTVTGMTNTCIYHMPDIYNSTDFLLATVDQAVFPHSYLIKPRSELLPGKRVLLNVNHPEPLELLMELFENTDVIYVRVKGTVQVKIGEYVASVDYYQEKIPARFNPTVGE